MWLFKETQAHALRMNCICIGHLSFMALVVTTLAFTERKMFICAPPTIMHMWFTQGQVFLLVLLGLSVPYV